jgi:hypothetical protein
VWLRDTQHAHPHRTRRRACRVEGAAGVSSPAFTGSFGYAIFSDLTALLLVTTAPTLQYP